MSGRGFDVLSNVLVNDEGMHFLARMGMRGQAPHSATAGARSRQRQGTQAQPAATPAAAGPPPAPTVAELVRAEEQRLGVDALTLVEKNALIERTATARHQEVLAAARPSSPAARATSDAYPTSWIRSRSEAASEPSGAGIDYPASWDVSALDVGEADRAVRGRRPSVTGYAGSGAGVDYPADWAR